MREVSDGLSDSSGVAVPWREPLLIRSGVFARRTELDLEGIREGRSERPEEVGMGDDPDGTGGEGVFGRGKVGIVIAEGTAGEIVEGADRVVAVADIAGSAPNFACKFCILRDKLSTLLAR